MPRYGLFFSSVADDGTLASHRSEISPSAGRTFRSIEIVIAAVPTALDTDTHDWLPTLYTSKRIPDHLDSRTTSTPTAAVLSFGEEKNYLRPIQ